MTKISISDRCAYLAKQHNIRYANAYARGVAAHRQGEPCEAPYTRAGWTVWLINAWKRGYRESGDIA